MIGRIKVPGGLKQWVPLSAGIDVGNRVLVPLYEVIRGNISHLYSGMNISAMALVRITRDAEVELVEDSEAEIRLRVKEQVRQRRYEPIVRLEFGRGADPGIRDGLCEIGRAS